MTITGKKRRTRWAPASDEEQTEADLKTHYVEKLKKDSELLRPLYSLVNDRQELTREILQILDKKTRNKLFPELKKKPEMERHDIVYAILRGMSRKRIRAILQGRDAPDSSSTESDEEDSDEVGEEIGDETSNSNENVGDPGEEPAEKAPQPENVSMEANSVSAQPSTSSAKIKKPKSSKNKKPGDELEEGEISTESSDSDDVKQNKPKFAEKTKESHEKSAKVVTEKKTFLTKKTILLEDSEVLLEKKRMPVEEKKRESKTDEKAKQRSERQKLEELREKEKRREKINERSRREEEETREKKKHKKKVQFEERRELPPRKSRDHGGYERRREQKTTRDNVQEPGPEDDGPKFVVTFNNISDADLLFGKDPVRKRIVRFALPELEHSDPSDDYSTRDDTASEDVVEIPLEDEQPEQNVALAEDSEEEEEKQLRLELLRTRRPKPSATPLSINYAEEHDKEHPQQSPSTSQTPGIPATFSINYSAAEESRQIAINSVTVSVGQTSSNSVEIFDKEMVDEAPSIANTRQTPMVAVFDDDELDDFEPDFELVE